MFFIMLTFINLLRNFINLLRLFPYIFYSEIILNYTMNIFSYLTHLILLEIFINKRLNIGLVISHKVDEIINHSVTIRLFLFSYY